MKYMYRESMIFPGGLCIQVHLLSNLQLAKEVLISWQKHLNREYWVVWGGGKVSGISLFTEAGKKRKETHIAVQNGNLQAKASSRIIAGTSLSKKSLFLDSCD